MNVPELYARIGPSGVALAVVAVVAAYLCAKYLVYLGWTGWARSALIRRAVAMT